MKKFTLSILAVVMTAVVLTSCIDNAVSSEVKAIRAAQVQLLTAQTALKNAEAAVQTSIAAMNAASANLTNAEAEEHSADAEAQVIANQKAASAAEVQIAQDQITLQTAIDDLAKYLLERDLKDAASFLGSYELASVAARNLAISISAATATIADLELYFITADGAYIDHAREIKENTLAAAELKLANAQAALEIMLTVEADPATAAAQLYDINSQIQDLDNQVLEQAIVIAPLQNAYNTANLADNTATADVAAAKAVVDAIAGVKAAVVKNAGEITTAQTAATKALTDANTKFAKELAQLAPYTSALVSAYATNAAFVDSVINISQAVKVATSALKVAQAQDNASPGSVATKLTSARTSMTNAISRVRALSKRTTATAPATVFAYSLADETTYPNYTPAQVGDYDLTLTAAATITAGATYTNGGVTYTFTDVVTASTAATTVTGKGVLAAGNVLTKATGTGDATVTIAVGGVVTVTPYVVNDQDGKINTDEITELSTHLLTVELNSANADPTSAWFAAGIVYTPVANFFDLVAPTEAYDLINTINKYDEATFLTNFATAKGVIADMPITGTGAEWLNVVAKDALVVVEQNHYTLGIKIGDKTADGVLDTESLDEYYVAVGAYGTAGNGGETDALSKETAAAADKTAADAVLTPLKAATTAAATALADANKVTTALNVQLADLATIKTAINTFVTTSNSQIAALKISVDTNQKLVDVADKDLQKLDLVTLKNIDDQIEYEEARLADLQEELAAKQAEAAMWLDLVNGALGN
jgi:trimeric autotransporter adhesin